MTEFGYAISSEEHGAAAAVANAGRAEQAGFGFALISDHFHSGSASSARPSADTASS